MDNLVVICLTWVGWMDGLRLALVSMHAFDNATRRQVLNQYYQTNNSHHGRAPSRPSMLRVTTAE